MLPTALVAMAYINTLNKFFAELKWKEPEVWKSIGSPDIKDMLRQPQHSLFKSFAFLPILRERGQRPARDYHYAGRAYRLLKTGLALSVLLAIITSVIVCWIVYHDL